jgi:glycosyltransferase involved in cell wall biosynthesis
MQKLSSIKSETGFSPLISIVMPTYNRANFIAETINSIQKQTYSNWELIIIDDGSTDQTGEVIDDIHDDRIRYYQESHLGMEHARNFGLEKATGEFIAFMDSDDLWAINKLDSQLNVFEEHPEIDFCLTGAYEFNSHNRPVVFLYKQRSGLKTDDLFLSFFKSELAALPQTLLLKRECLDAVGPIQNIELAHIHFILALALQYKGAILYETLLYRRMHESSYSTVNHTKRHHDGIELIKHYKNMLPRQVYSQALLRSHINFGETCLTKKLRLNAAKEFFHAWRCQPFNIVPIKKIAKALLQPL